MIYNFQCLQAMFAMQDFALSWKKCDTEIKHVISKVNQIKVNAFILCSLNFDTKRLIKFNSPVRSLVNPYTVQRRSRTAATFKMEHFVIIVNGWKPLTIITKRSILDVAAALDPRLIWQKQFIIIIIKRGSRTAATSKMEHFVIIVNGWKLLTIITKRSISDTAAVLDLPP